VSQPPHDATETELSILQILWETRGATVRQIVDQLYPGGGSSAPPTVQKLIQRLEAKGFVVRDRSGPVQVFRAAVDRGELISQRLHNVARDLCDGSMTSLLTHLVKDERLGATERAALRKLVDEWSTPEKPGR
jgi:BlaI family penicillinase repressor